MKLFPTLRARVSRGAVLVLLLAVPLGTLAAGQQTFATPEAAVDALIGALKANDEGALLSVLGSDHKNIVSTGDLANDAAWRAQAVANFETFHALDDSRPDRRVLKIGAQAWPMPIPLVRSGNEWRFATDEGVEEILNRRIGANERSAINVLHAYLDAQRDYASRDRMGDGVLQYARKIASSPGRRDGLYWPSDAAHDDEPSPFGPLIADSATYLKDREPGGMFRGYQFRILTRQSKNAPGGPYSYVINGRMIGGFAMVAYPGHYGETGVMTFMVSHNGTIYEKNLGPDTARIAGAMNSFDPGSGWKKTLP